MFGTGVFIHTIWEYVYSLSSLIGGEYIFSLSFGELVFGVVYLWWLLLSVYRNL